MKYIDLLRTRPIAIETGKANEQHYEVGTGVLSGMLGSRMKYSCCLYPKGTETLAQAEMAMLELYVHRAGLQDGMRVFDLGYGILVLVLVLVLLDSACPPETDTTCVIAAAGARYHYTLPKSTQSPESQLSPTPRRKRNISTLWRVRRI